MPLHFIDRAALTALGAAGFYLVFLRAGTGIPAGALLAFVATALARRLLSRLPRRYVATRAQAEAALWAIARMPDGEAGAALRALTGREDLLCALRPADARLSPGEVFALWRARRDSEGLAIAATCPAEAGAASLAGELGVALIDGPALVKRIRQTGLYVPPDAPKPRPFARLSRAARALLHRPPTLRAALYGASLLAMYWITGLPLYLAFSMAVLFVTGARGLRSRTP